MKKSALILSLIFSTICYADTFGGSFIDFGPRSAYEVLTNKGNFGGILTASDTNVQQALATLSFITASPTTVSSDWYFGSGRLGLPQGTSCASSCGDGDICYDTNATSGQRVYACESGTWTLQGDGTGAGGGDEVSINGAAATNANFINGEISFSLPQPSALP